MFLDITNFVFVYAMSGMIVSIIAYSLFRRHNDKKFSLLLGYGLAPLLISLILCYLYCLFPHKTWAFYASIIYGLFFLMLVIYLRQIFLFLKINCRVAAKNLRVSAINSNVLSKITFFFILFVVIFSFIRGSIYPNTWFDSLSYLQQGYIYSQDRSLDRLATKAPFSNFNNNKIAPPAETYTMDTAIRPALPIFYSFFFEKTVLPEAEYFSTRFVYFYYFLLAIFALYYYLKKYNSYALIGVGVFVSCFYTLAFGPILNAKEVILLFLSFLSVMVISEMREAESLVKVRYAIIIGILIGLGIFINLSGIIIGGILFLLFIKELGIKKKAMPLILAAAIAIAVFSGFELKSIFTFVLNRDLISIQNISGTFKSPEMESYKIASGFEIKGNEVSKLNILLMGKLQGFIQIQFYGVIFIVFLIALFRTLKKHTLNNITKNVLLYMGLFFFIVMDPFFLNPQKYAYVLSISPKYTVLLTIFAAFFIAHHFDDLIKIQEKVSRKLFLLTASYFLFFISIASLILPVRNIFVNISYLSISKIAPLYNNPNYYIDFLNNFILTIAILYIVLFLSLKILKKFNKIENISLTSMLSFVIISLFILPNLFLLNSNYDIYGTFTHAFYSSNAVKVGAVTNSPNEKQLFEMINYINKNIDNKKTILIILMPKSSSYYNVWYFTNNNIRLKMLGKDSSQNIDSTNYLLLSKTRLSNFMLPNSIMQIRENDNYVLYKVS